MVIFTIDQTLDKRFRLTLKHNRLKASAAFVQITFDTYEQAWAELKSRVLAE